MVLILTGMYFMPAISHIIFLFNFDSLKMLYLNYLFSSHICNIKVQLYVLSHVVALYMLTVQYYIRAKWIILFCCQDEHGSG